MTLLYYDPEFLTHKTGDHPESPNRLLTLMRHMSFVGLDAACHRPHWQLANTERLGRVHDQEYIRFLEAFAADGGGQLNADTVMSRESFHVASMATGAVCDAVERVIQGEDANALCLVRPPGHHALEANSMGFCLFNQVAVASRVATEEYDLDRVLIVDWDVHHGNGTQATFWEDASVGFLSIHRWPFYPGTGASDETGAGDGLGTTLNLPIEFGTTRQDFLSHFTRELENFAEKLQPQLVLLSAGFDSHHLDPVGSLGLETEDFVPLTKAVLAVAQQHAGGRLVSVLEGGYNPEALTDCVEVHLEELLHA